MYLKNHKDGGECWTQQQPASHYFHHPTNPYCIPERKKKTMAEGVLFDLGKKVLEVVGSLAFQEIKLTCGVEAELENLKSTVSTIQAVLLDAEKQGSHNNEVKDWLNKLRDVLHDTDDVLDDFSTEALQHKVMAGNKMTKETLILQDCPSLKELPRGIKKLVNLRFLDVTYCSFELTNMPLEIEQLTYLETILPGVIVRKEGSGASCSGSYKKKKAKSNGGPSQLKELHNLGGKLRIENLGYGKDDVWECKDANLNNRQHLQQLELKWGSWNGESECDEMLEGLQPHPNLKRLGLYCYMGVRIPSWVSCLTNLVEFELVANDRLQHLPPLNQLPFIKVVSLEGMEALEYISDEDSVSNVLGASSSSSSSASSKTPFFPSLTSLSIHFCPNLKGWWRNSDDDDELHHLLLPSFPPSLSELWIIECPNLTSIPPFPYLKEWLVLSGRKVLEQTMRVIMGAATTSTYFPLSQLQHISLSQMNDFESLPEEWLRNLVSLRELSIYSCDGLSSLHWIGILTSLQALEIESCPNLTSLPQEIRNLTSLKGLRIEDCPLLGQRCKRQIGEDWPIIAHVPRVLVDRQNQQRETISSESESVCQEEDLTNN
ncbi:hypothetical protein ACB092_11G200300 [Castanea dentata]